jgi:biopolymer transport protein TolR
MGASLGGGGSRGGRGHGYRRQQFTEINVTPFVDVMLVLLIIFMVTAPMLTAGVEVELPDSKAGSVQGQDEPLVVTIKADGLVYVQETKILADSLIPKLKAIAGEKYDTRIFVRGDTSVDYGKIMKIVGDISYAGFKKVALITENKTSGR